MEKRTLQEMRQFHRYTQKEASEETGVPFATLVAYELGYRKVPVERAIALARFYGCRVEDIEWGNTHD